MSGRTDDWTTWKALGAAVCATALVVFGAAGCGDDGECSGGEELTTYEGEEKCRAQCDTVADCPNQTSYACRSTCPNQSSNACTSSFCVGTGGGTPDIGPRPDVDAGTTPDTTDPDGGAGDPDGGAGDPDGGASDPDGGGGADIESCSAVVQCTNNCQSQSCVEDCRNRSSTEAWNNFDALVTCQSDNCSSQCGQSGSTEECQTCMSENCSTELSDCGLGGGGDDLCQNAGQGDLSCAAGLICASSCGQGDRACVNSAIGQTTSDECSKLDTYLTCRDDNCANANDSGQCIEQNCSMEQEACLGPPDKSASDMSCGPTLLCISDCPDDDPDTQPNEARQCQDDCLSRSTQSAQAALTTYSQCMDQNCNNAQDAIACRNQNCNTQWRNCWRCP